MGKPKPLSEDGLYQYALKALAARARSTGELRRMLERRAARKADAAQVLGRLKESGYLNDQKFAQSYAAWRLENQRLGRFRVERDLRARLVAPRLAERAVEETYRNVDEGRLLREHLARRLRHSGPPKDRRALASLYRHLLGAGFSTGTIVAEVRKLSKGDTDWLEELVVSDEQ